MTRSDEAFGLVELTVALGVLSLVVMGMAGAMTAGMGVIGISRQRSSASAEAAKRIEQARSLSYDQIALDEAPVHTTDSSNPDSAVSTDGSYYNVGSGSWERLDVDLDNGEVEHIAVPVHVGSTELSIYQYVTWVDDNGDGFPDYKRVTIVVTWHNPQRGGVSNKVTMTTFIGPGGIDIAPPSPTPLPSLAPTPSPAPTPAPTPPTSPSICPGDTSPPQGQELILTGSGADSGYSSSTAVQVYIKAVDNCGTLRAELSNDGTTYYPGTTLLSGVGLTIPWTIPSGEVAKTVYARFYDGVGNVSSPFTATVVLDQTPPTVAGNLREVTCKFRGKQRNVTLTWDPSIDLNLSGYRLYRSVGTDAFVPIATTLWSSLSFSDTTQKRYNPVRYLVRAYDKAGNESGDSNVVTYRQNRC